MAIPVPLRLSEAQQLYDAIHDPLLRPALTAFFKEQYEETAGKLLQAVRQPVRNTMKEARLAGKAEVYEECLSDLQQFAEKQLRNATQ